MRWLQALRDYASNADARAGAANLLALSVVFNQPFYPLYLYLASERTAFPAIVTALSTPFFAAVPAVARRNPFLGKVLMVVAGAGNTFLCTKAFGQASGVELFLIPCALLCLILFRREEWRAALALLVAMGATYLLLNGRYGAPLREFSTEEYQAVYQVNAISVASISVLIGLLGRGSGSLSASRTRWRNNRR